MAGASVASTVRRRRRRRGTAGRTTTAAAVLVASSAAWLATTTTQTASAFHAPRGRVPDTTRGRICDRGVVVGVVVPWRRMSTAQRRTPTRLLLATEERLMWSDDDPAFDWEYDNGGGINNGINNGISSGINNGNGNSYSLDDDDVNTNFETTDADARYGALPKLSNSESRDTMSRPGPRLFSVTPSEGLRDRAQAQAQAQSQSQAQSWTTNDANGASPPPPPPPPANDGAAATWAPPPAQSTYGRSSNSYRSTTTDAARARQADEAARRITSEPAMRINDENSFAPVTATFPAAARYTSSSSSSYTNTVSSDVFLCPLSYVLPLDPVTAQDGITYERRAIEQYISQQGRRRLKSPVTGERMDPQLLPNAITRNAIEQLVRNGSIDGVVARRWKKYLRDEDALRAAFRGVENGDASSMCRLGNWYSYGQRGLERDPARGYAWYRTAADCGCARGMTYAGICLLTGDGVPERSETEGMTLLGMAAQGGNDLAAYWLGVCYKDGLDGLAQNDRREEAWLNRIAERKARDGFVGAPINHVREMLTELNGGNDGNGNGNGNGANGGRENKKRWWPFG